MATIKSYTSLEQSRKLAEILPIESADMWWSRCTIIDFGDGILKVSYAVEPCNISQFENTKEDVPCWSLASLLDILQYPILFHNGDKEWGCTVWIDTTKPYSILPKDSPIDACYEMIICLNKQKLL